MSDFKAGLELWQARLSSDAIREKEAGLIRA
jgi:hypothetical protein